jgi:tetratricopeptide (TPR) repeat protein
MVTSSISAKSVLLKFLVGLLFISIASPAWTVERGEHPFGITLKISRLAQTLDRIDALMQEMQPNSRRSTTQMLRGMFQGTDWIDPQRVIVVGVDIQASPAQVAAFIPILQPQESFRQAFNATLGESGYFISLQPKNRPVAPELQERLSRTSGQVHPHPVYLELALSDLIAYAEKGIDQLIDSQASRSSAMVDRQKMTEMVSSMAATLGQVDVLGLGLDFDENFFKFIMQTRSVEGSPLAGLLSVPGEITRLDGYDPKGYFTFRSRSCDVKGFMDFMSGIYAGIYRELGIDFAEMTDIWKHFDGEAVSGMATTKKGPTFEMLAVLKDSEHLPDFAEKIYLPWLEKYSQTMLEILKAQAKTKIPQPFVRTPDSTIEGYKVIGVRTQLPLVPGIPDLRMQESASKERLLEYDMRMTTVDNILVMAPDDKRLAQLIAKAQDINEKSAAGPLLTARLELGKYFESMAQYFPIAPRQSESLADIGPLEFKVITGKGKLQSVTTIPLQDIERVLAHMEMADKSGTSSEKGGKPLTATTVKSPPDDVSAQEGPPLVKNARYWFDRGCLVAAYGNDKAAIRYFQKALSMDPSNSTAFFNMGISYGELGQYAKALETIDKAIQMDPQKAVYYYGRGRVHLLAGDTEAAHKDISHAAQEGHPDAVAYLKKHGKP